MSRKKERLDRITLDQVKQLDQMTKDQRKRKGAEKEIAVRDMLAEAEYFCRNNNRLEADDIVRKFRDRYRASCQQSLSELNMDSCNPYLFAAEKNMSTAQLVREYVSAKYHASKETRFGHLLEDAAGTLLNRDWIPRAERKRLSAEKELQRTRSGIKGVDLEVCRIDAEGRHHRYFLALKSGENWGNAGSHAAQGSYFKAAKGLITDFEDKSRTRALMVVMYGKGNHLVNYADWELIGQQAWTFVTGDPRFHLRVAELLQEGATEFNVQIQWAKAVAEARIMQELQKNGLLTEQGELNILSLVHFYCSNVETQP